MQVFARSQGWVPLPCQRGGRGGVRIPAPMGPPPPIGKCLGGGNLRSAGTRGRTHRDQWGSAAPSAHRDQNPLLPIPPPPPQT